MKDELIRKMMVELRKAFDVDLTTTENILLFCFADYEVSKKETAVIPLSDAVESNEELLRQFLTTKMTQGRSKRTLRYYAEILRVALAKIDKSAVDITSDDIRTYLAVRQFRDNVTYITANNERRVLSSFFEWLKEDAEKISRNPMRKIDNIKGRQQVKKAFTEVEVEKIRSACKTNRERAIIEVLLSTACRATEVVEMRRDMIKGDAILVIGKGNKERIALFNAKALIALENYLNERKDANPYIFPKMVSIGEATKAKTKKKNTNQWYTNPKNIDPVGHMDISSLRQIVSRLGKSVGVENVHPHRFRRTAATMALKHGMPVEQVSKMLGHSQLTTTQIYLDLNEDMLREAHKKYM